MNTVTIPLDLNTGEGYRTFLRVKALPTYRFIGRTAVVPAEYAAECGVGCRRVGSAAYAPRPWLFDYQLDIAAVAVRRRKFAVFADCGLGKTAVMLEFARHALAALPRDRRVLIVSPLMVVTQTVAEAERFYPGDPPPAVVRAKDLPAWLSGRLPGRVGITNYEAITARVTDPGSLGTLILDESSLLKSQYGRWGGRLIALGRGLDWKLCLTGTPAPNDRIEYANHAVFLDQFPTVNSFLAQFFVNRGETANRWELKPHARRPFYRALSHWCVFLSNPGVYGWKDNAAPLPPIRTHVVGVPLTRSQRDAAWEAGGDLFGTIRGGIGGRSKMAQIAKGFGAGGRRVVSNKMAVVRELALGNADGGTLVWCRYNAEQDALARRLPGAANVAGNTPLADRLRLTADFKAGTTPVLITKPKILGFGLNLQVATRHVFSTVQDSYEEYYQAVKRSNRVGSVKPLDVYIPVTDLERPMLETVLAKAGRVAADTAEQEQLFREVARVGT